MPQQGNTHPQPPTKALATAIAGEEALVSWARWWNPESRLQLLHEACRYVAREHAKHEDPAVWLRFMMEEYGMGRRSAFQMLAAGNMLLKTDGTPYEAIMTSLPPSKLDALVRIPTDQLSFFFDTAQGLGGLLKMQERVIRQMVRLWLSAMD